MYVYLKPYLTNNRAFQDVSTFIVFWWFYINSFRLCKTVTTLHFYGTFLKFKYNHMPYFKTFLRLDLDPDDGMQLKN